jgi:hypothetical protein
MEQHQTDLDEVSSVAALASNPNRKKNRKTQIKLEMQVYLLLIFTSMMFSVPSKQQSTTLVQFWRFKGLRVLFLSFLSFL